MVFYTHRECVKKADATNFTSVDDYGSDEELLKIDIFTTDFSELSKKAIIKAGKTFFGG
jgi:hypothetical protein